VSAERSVWLVSARFDWAVFVAPALLSIAAAAFTGALADPGAQTPSWAFLLLIVGVDVAHVHGTTLRVYLDPGELRRRRRLYLLVPAVGFAGGVVAYALSPGLFWRCLAYIAVFHFVRQQIGWARLYRKRAGETSRFDARLDEATLYAAMLYPLIAWHSRLPVDFHWFVPGDFIGGLPPAITAAARAIWAALLIAFFARQLQLVLRGERLRAGKLLLVATTAATWWTGIVLLANDFAFTVTNVVAHGVPYLVMSWRIQRERGAGPGLGSLVFRALPLYALVLFGLAFAEEWLWEAAVWQERLPFFPAPAFDTAPLAGVIVPLLALPQLTHYVLDAYLWRLDGQNPGLAEALGVASRRRSG
jgi:hypothetical protein